MAVLWTIIDEQQNACPANAVDKQIEQCLGLTVDPVQVLKSYHQWLLKAFTQNDTL